MNGVNFWILCAIFIIAACGGGGGCGSSPTSPSHNMTFTGVSSPENNTVYMAKNDAMTDGDVIAIDVKLNNISDYVYGTSLSIDFDAAKIGFIGYSKGSFLEQGGNTATSYMWAESVGKLSFGITRLGGVGGISGSGTLVTLKFKAIEAGNSTISFNGCTLKDPALNTIVVANWDGGAVIAQ